MSRIDFKHFSEIPSLLLSKFFWTICIAVSVLLQQGARALVFQRFTARADPGTVVLAPSCSWPDSFSIRADLRQALDSVLVLL